MNPAVMMKEMVIERKKKNSQQHNPHNLLAEMYDFAGQVQPSSDLRPVSEIHTSPVPSDYE